MNNTLKKNVIKGVELYTGKEVFAIYTYDDPLVPETYAIKAEFVDKSEPLTALLVSLTSNATPEEVLDRIDECEFKSWPPKSDGKLRFEWGY